MTKADREYVEVAAELAASKAVNKMKTELNCENHTKTIAGMEPVISGNTKGIKAVRKMVFWMLAVLLVTFVGSAIAANVYGQEVVYTNQVTVTWDVTTTLTDGRPIPAEDTVAYEVYRNDELIAEIDLPPYTMTIEPEVTTKVGVRAKRVTAVYEEVTYSNYLWSDIGGVPNPWVIRSILPLSNIGNMRIQ